VIAGFFDKSSAELSVDGKYRYSLGRVWDEDNPKRACFIMLNPSTADATTNDPTIRSCTRLAKGFGCGGLAVVNLFAYRATNPRELRNTGNPVEGQPGRNDAVIRSVALQCVPLIVAWGRMGAILGRDRAVLGILADFKPIYCLGRNGDGSPIHPLYVKSGTVLEEFQ
jgi:hypothetical protein